MTTRHDHGLRYTSAALLSLLMTCILTAVPTPAQAAERPNVLFIAIDDLNDWISVFGGHPKAVTPHLDRLAREGMRFTDYYSSAPVCAPARCTSPDRVLRARRGGSARPRPGP